MRKFLTIFAVLFLFLLSSAANGEENSASGAKPAPSAKNVSVDPGLSGVGVTQPAADVKKDLVASTSPNVVDPQPMTDKERNSVVAASGAGDKKGMSDVNVVSAAVDAKKDMVATTSPDVVDSQPMTDSEYSSAESGMSVDDDTDTYKVRAGDMLQIRAYGIDSWHEPGIFVRVSEDGQIQLPLLGLVKVAGLDATDAAKKLDDMLMDGYVTDPQLCLVIHERIGWEDYRTFSVSGAVKRPGVYRSEGTLKLIDAVNWGGGLADNADPTRVRLSRIGDDYVKRDYILNLFQEGMDFNVRSRDRIFVQSYGMYTICGEVMRPGKYYVGEKTRAADTILDAGGFTQDALRNSVTVLRKQGNGRLSLRTSGKDKTRWTSGNKIITNGKWHHVVVTMARSEEKSKKKKRTVFETVFYVDGKKSGEKECNPITPSGAQNLFIGKQNDGVKPFKGAIADLRIYKRALNEKEVKKRFKEDEEITDGLISIWNKAGENGLEIFDDHGGNKGVNQGADVVTGLVQKKEPAVYFYFDEKDDYIDCGTGADLDLTEELTVEAWINTSSQAFQTIISRYDIRNPSNGYVVNIGGGDYNKRTRRINAPVGHIFETGNKDDNIKIEEGDIIIVDESFF